jgi:hypothetical protein
MGRCLSAGRFEFVPFPDGFGIEVPSFDAPRAARLDFSTSHISSDTIRWKLSKRSTLSFVAHLTAIEDGTLLFEPLIIGAPWLHRPEGVPFDAMWLHGDFYEHFIEDIDEFAGAANVSVQADWSVMREIRERAFKACLTAILGDEARADWGGERSDHFTANLHLQGRRLTSAFLLKGPGVGFVEMQPAHLSRNGDQVVRLAS